MYLSRTKVKAFSLTELLVVLVLSAMTVGIIYNIYYAVRQYHANLSKKMEAVNGLSRFYFLLQTDFDRSDHIYATSAENLTCQSGHTRAHVIYQFSETFVIREQSGQVDTFLVKLNNPVFSFRQDTLHAGRYPFLVDKLRATLAESSVPVNIVIEKTYASSSLTGVTGDTPH